MQNTLTTDDLEWYFFSKNIKYLAVRFDRNPPADWISTTKANGARNSIIIDGVAWHQFHTWKKALDFTTEFQGLITPDGVLEVFSLDLPSDATFPDLVEAVYNLRAYDGAPPA